MRQARCGGERSKRAKAIEEPIIGWLAHRAESRRRRPWGQESPSVRQRKPVLSWIRGGQDTVASYRDHLNGGAIERHFTDDLAAPLQIFAQRLGSALLQQYESFLGGDVEATIGNGLCRSPVEDQIRQNQLSHIGGDGRSTRTADAQDGATAFDDDSRGHAGERSCPRPGTVGA